MMFQVIMTQLYTAVHSCVHNPPPNVLRTASSVCCHPTLCTGWVWLQQQPEHVTGKQPTAVPTNCNISMGMCPGHADLLAISVCMKVFPFFPSVPQTMNLQHCLFSKNMKPACSYFKQQGVKWFFSSWFDHSEHCIYFIYRLNRCKCVAVANFQNLALKGFFFKDKLEK